MIPKHRTKTPYAIKCSFYRLQFYRSDFFFSYLWLYGHKNINVNKNKNNVITAADVANAPCGRLSLPCQSYIIRNLLRAYSNKQILSQRGGGWLLCMWRHAKYYCPTKYNMNLKTSYRHTYVIYGSVMVQKMIHRCKSYIVV